MAVEIKKFPYKLQLTDLIRRQYPSERIVSLGIQDLINVPDLTGQANKFLQVNNTATGIQYVDSSGMGGGLNSGNAFPASPQNNEIFLLLQTSGSSQVGIYQYQNTDWVFIIGVTAPLITFLSLSDTPSAFGTAGQLVKINSSADGLEFVDDVAGVTTFLALTDTPSAFTANMFLRVNSAGTALELVAEPAGLTQSEVDARVTALTDPAALIGNSAIWLVGKIPDLPASKITSGIFDSGLLASGGSVGQILTRTASGQAWEDTSGGGATTFDGLTDTPASKTASQFVRANSTGTALEFVDLPSGTPTTFDSLTDTPASKTADKFVRVNSAGTALEYVDAPSGGSGFELIGRTANLFEFLGANGVLRSGTRLYSSWGGTGRPDTSGAFKIFSFANEGVSGEENGNVIQIFQNLTTGFVYNRYYEKPDTDPNPLTIPSEIPAGTTWSTQFTPGTGGGLTTAQVNALINTARATSFAEAEADIEKSLKLLVEQRDIEFSVGQKTIDWEDDTVIAGGNVVLMQGIDGDIVNAGYTETPPETNYLLKYKGRDIPFKLALFTSNDHISLFTSVSDPELPANLAITFNGNTHTRDSHTNTDETRRYRFVPQTAITVGDDFTLNVTGTNVEFGTLEHTNPVFRTIIDEELIKKVKSKIVVVSNDDGSIRSATADDYHNRALAIIGQNIRIATKIPVSTVNVTYEDNYDPWASDSAVNYRGVYNNYYDRNNAAARDGVYSKNQHGFYVYTAADGWTFPRPQPANVRGNYANEAEANNHITANGQVAEWGNELHRVTAYTAGVEDGYIWGQLQDIQTLIDSLSAVETGLEGVQTSISNLTTEVETKLDKRLADTADDLTAAEKIAFASKAIPTADDPTATEVSVSTTDFGNNLSSSDNTVQKALNTLDDLDVSSDGGSFDIDGLSTDVLDDDSEFGFNKKTPIRQHLLYAENQEVNFQRDGGTENYDVNLPPPDAPRREGAEWGSADSKISDVLWSGRFSDGFLSLDLRSDQVLELQALAWRAVGSVGENTASFVNPVGFDRADVNFLTDGFTTPQSWRRHFFIDIVQSASSFPLTPAFLWILTGSTLEKIPLMANDPSGHNTQGSFWWTEDPADSSFTVEELNAKTFDIEFTNGAFLFTKLGPYKLFTSTDITELNNNAVVTLDKINRVNTDRGGGTFYLQGHKRVHNGADYLRLTLFNDEALTDQANRDDINPTFAHSTMTSVSFNFRLADFPATNELKKTALSDLSRQIAKFSTPRDEQLQQEINDLRQLTGKLSVTGRPTTDTEPVLDSLHLTAERPDAGERASVREDRTLTLNSSFIYSNANLATAFTNRGSLVPPDDETLVYVDFNLGGSVSIYLETSTLEGRVPETIFFGDLEVTGFAVSVQSTNINNGKTAIAYQSTGNTQPENTPSQFNVQFTDGSFLFQTTVITGPEFLTYTDTVRSGSNSHKFLIIERPFDEDKNDLELLLTADGTSFPDLIGDGRNFVEIPSTSVANRYYYYELVDAFQEQGVISIQSRTDSFAETIYTGKTRSNRGPTLPVAGADWLPGELFSLLNPNGPFTGETDITFTQIASNIIGVQDPFSSSDIYRIAFTESTKGGWIQTDGIDSEEVNSWTHLILGNTAYALTPGVLTVDGNTLKQVIGEDGDLLTGQDSPFNDIDVGDTVRSSVRKRDGTYVGGATPTFEIAHYERQDTTSTDLEDVWHPQALVHPDHEEILDTLSNHFRKDRDIGDAKLFLNHTRGWSDGLSGLDNVPSDFPSAIHSITWHNDISDTNRYRRFVIEVTEGASDRSYHEKTFVYRGTEHQLFYYTRSGNNNRYRTAANSQTSDPGSTWRRLNLENISYEVHEVFTGARAWLFHKGD